MIVFLGGLARTCAIGGPYEWLTWYEHENGLRTAFHPHPSGRNRWWNEDENVKRATEFWKELRL